MKNILKLKFKEKGVITINGVNYSGTNIIMDGNGNLIIDGESVMQIQEKVVNVNIEGDVDEVSTTNGGVTVEGAVGSVETTNGDIDIDGDVAKDVRTTNGNVIARVIHGSVKTVNGNIKTK